ncbi:Trk system potassium transporter TrkA [Candidatus Kaiserbacteria bacterium]|nr:Trk system potassium transporter TrkA [Candidatus Kaiserbacteria bacterium]
MKVVVAGAGDLGTYLIDKLTEQKHSVSVIDSNRDLLDRLSRRYDVSTLRGNVLAYDNLNSVKINETDLFIAVTSSEELNLMSAILAKRMGVVRTVARVRHAKLVKHDDVFKFNDLGIDEVISPDSLVADEIEMLLDRQAFSDLIEFEHGKYFVTGLQTTEKDRFIGKTLSTLTPSNPDAFIPFALMRDTKTYLVSADMKIESGDQLYFISQQRGLSTLARMGGARHASSRRVMILGGSRAGIETARRLTENGYQVTIIERNQGFANDLAEYLPEVLVVNGDSREVWLLEEHDIEGMQAVVAATGNPEHNLLACLAAKKYNVPYTVALVQDVYHSQTAHTFGVDALVNKKLIAADYIMRHVKKSSVLGVATISGLDMEVNEFLVKENSLLANDSPFMLSAVKETKIVIGAVIRDNQPLHLSDNLLLKPNDKLIAACHRDLLDYLQKLF